MTTPTVFTLGYQQRSIADFIRLLIEAEIDVLVDVRQTAWSHKPGFSKGALARTLQEHGITYVHASFTGNPKRLRSTASSHEECLRRYAEHLDENVSILELFDELVGRLLDDGRRVCLTCYERHPDDCHRGVLTERWQAGSWRAVEHLGAEGAPRLLQV